MWSKRRRSAINRAAALRTDCRRRFSRQAGRPAREALSPHSTTPPSTPNCPTLLHPYVRHARFPREDVGIGVVECGLCRDPAATVQGQRPEYAVDRWGNKTSYTAQLMQNCRAASDGPPNILFACRGRSRCECQGHVQPSTK